MNARLYALLDLSPGASLADVRAAYRRLAAKYHPDVCGQSPAAVARFRAIAEAHERLVKDLSSPSRAEAASRRPTPKPADYPSSGGFRPPPFTPPREAPRPAYANAQMQPDTTGTGNVFEDAVDDIFGMFDNVATLIGDLFGSDKTSRR